MNQLENGFTLSVVCICLFMLAYYGIIVREDLKIPKFYDLECVVIRQGIHKPVEGYEVPKSYVIIRSLRDKNLVTQLNTVNFPSFIDFKYKVGDTLRFKFINKNRFWNEIDP